MLHVERSLKSQKCALQHTFIWSSGKSYNNGSFGLKMVVVHTMVAFFSAALAAFCTLRIQSILAQTALEIPIQEYTPSDETGPLGVYYDSAEPLVFAANVSGLFSYSLPALTSTSAVRRDTKSVTTLYGERDRDDWLVSLVIEDSLLAVTNLKNPRRTSHLRLWGDYSAVCAVGSSFVYIFGKGHAKLVQIERGNIKEICEFAVPVEAEACAATAAGTVFFGGNDGVVYSFAGNAVQPGSSIQQTSITVDGEIAGMAVYESSNNASSLFVSVESGTVEVFSTAEWAHQYTLSFSEEDVELEGIAIYQRTLPGYPDGSLVVSFTEDDGRTGTGIVSLTQIPLPRNANFNPRDASSNPDASNQCTRRGFRNGSECICFTGYTGSRCNQRTCPNDCSSRGRCVGPNTCRCDNGWTGPDCSFKVVLADIETDANGGDGDDPAIWIHPTDRTKSRVLTTTKSKQGAGFALFDLAGQMIFQLPAGEPNNVDVIYNFELEDGRTVDLGVAACRDEDTLCLMQVTEGGLTDLVNLPVKPDFSVYGSCVYHSRISGKHYIFVNSKTAEYLQYELTPSLGAVLVREFIGGNGGQVEGCVGDDENGFVYIGEEPYGLWRYGAEPDAGTDRVLVDSIEGNLFPDVEGVTLVHGPTPDKGLLIVSAQGVSAFNIYRRGTHEFVGTFTVQAGQVDKVTNTDGVAAVGTNLGVEGFEMGVVVVHDDVNSAPDGSREDGASFKIVGLGQILETFGLEDEVDTSWDPRQ
ncbi:phytase L [Coprinopsis cinerea AmutBmut pab1-1]|nr:phytase L [Coprinopsis cinerea AmutBmut pab1-1]